MDRTLKLTWIACILFSACAALGVFLLHPYTDNIQFLPDEGFNWYYWKLPDPTFMSRATSWGFYIAHQAFIWWAIWWGQKHRKELTNWKRMHWINFVMIFGTAFFIFLHYVQTAIWFDGLGQDMPVIMSQGSVVVLLIVILVMEAPRRGLFFGKVKPFREILPWLYKYHGYVFAWGLVFTFWYHPMYPTWGHVTGFFYMFLLFTQMNLMYTEIHVNRYWTFTMETLVIVHGITMAVVNGNGMWAMFGFGFAAAAVITQIYGLGLSKTARIAIWAVFLIALVVAYSYRGWEHIGEVIRIPVIYYLGAFLIGGVLTLFWRRKHPRTKQAAE